MGGNASPIIVGDKLFYTAEPAELIGVDASSGKELWRSSNALEDVAEMSPADREHLRQIIQANKTLPEKLEPINRRIYQLNRRLRSHPSNERLLQQLEKAEAEKAHLEVEAGIIPEGLP